MINEQFMDNNEDHITNWCRGTVSTARGDIGHIKCREHGGKVLVTKNEADDHETLDCECPCHPIVTQPEVDDAIAGLLKIAAGLKDEDDEQ